MTRDEGRIKELRGNIQIASESPQPCQCTFLVAAREAAEADHVSGQDSGKLALFRHGGVTLRPSETGESLR